MGTKTTPAQVRPALMPGIWSAKLAQDCMHKSQLGTVMPTMSDPRKSLWQYRMKVYPLADRKIELSVVPFISPLSILQYVIGSEALLVGAANVGAFEFEGVV